MKRLLISICIGCWISPVAAGRVQDTPGWADRYNAGIQAIEQGRYAEASELFQSLVRDAERSGGEGNRLSMSLYGLALSRYRQNEFAGAAPLFRRSLTIL